MTEENPLAVNRGIFAVLILSDEDGWLLSGWIWNGHRSHPGAPYPGTAP